MRFLRANGVSLHVAEITATGSAPPGTGTAVLIHGMAGDNMASWYFSLGYPLAEHGMRVLVHDLRGHGRSERPARGYAFDDFVDDLEGLIDQWDISGPVHLFGNSFGGTVAFGYAARHPERVAAITAIDSAPPIAAWFTRLSNRISAIPEVPPAGRGRLFASRLKDMQGLLAETTVGAELPASLLPDPAAFASVTCPVLCLYGGESRVRELAGETERLLPQTRSVVLEGAGHTVLVDRKEQVWEHVSTWLDDTTSPIGCTEGRTHG